MIGNNAAAVVGAVMMNKECALGQYLLSLKVPEAFPTPDPGQFVMLKAALCQTPLLARPFSIYAFTRREDHSDVEILYRVAGRGTRLLSSASPGSLVSIVGPLGNGFTIIPERKNIVLIAGGVGIAPLTFLAGYYLDFMRERATKKKGLHRRVIFYAGAGTSDALAGIERIEGFCEEIKVSTDDGSGGFRGTVTKLFGKDMAFYNPDDTAIYACGPAPMLKDLAAILPGDDFFCQISVEERMACGLGACLGCVLPVKDGNGQMGYKRVCKEGPVFNIRDVVWSD